MESIKERKTQENKFSSTYKALIKMGIANKNGNIEEQNFQSSLFSLATQEFFEAVKARKLNAVLTYIVNNRVNINDTNEHGHTALILAVENNDAEMVELLLSYGANVNINYGSTFNHLTPFHIAVDKGNFEIAQLLLENLHEADTYYANSRGSSLPPKNQADINDSATFYGTALISSIRKRNKKMVEWLLKHGANINFPNPYTRETPLHAACKLGQDADIFYYWQLLLEHSNDGNINYTNRQGVSLTSNNRADITAKDKNGYSAFIVGCKELNSKHIKVFLEYMTYDEITASRVDLYSYLSPSGTFSRSLLERSQEKFVPILTNIEEALTTIKKAEAHAAMNNKASLSPELLELLKENTNLPMDNINIIRDYIIEFKTADARKYLIEHGILDQNGMPIIIPNDVLAE